MSARAPIIPCPECGARHGDQCTYAKCPRKSFPRVPPKRAVALGVAPRCVPSPRASLSVVDGFPLASTGPVRGHCDLLTSKPEFLGGVTPPITSEFSGSSSFSDCVLKNPVNGITQRNHGANPWR